MKRIFLKRASKGLTLTETILAAAVMGVIAIVILPYFLQAGYTGLLALRSGATQVASDIRLTRQYAVTKGITHRIYFDFAAREYGIYNGSVSSENLVGETQTISSSVNCSGTDQFDFGKLGNVSYNGTGLILSSGSHEYNISAEATTGALFVNEVS